jgi:hypothetical protein
MRLNEANYILELMITKMLVLQQQTQLVGMSAMLSVVLDISIALHG